MHIRTAESLQDVCPCGQWRPGQGRKPVGIARIGLDAMNYEKMQSSRRSARPSTRKWSLLVGARIVRPESGIFSSERALSDEKAESSRRSTRSPSRRSYLL